MKLGPTQLMVLKACRDLPKDQYGNVHDDEVARETKLPQENVQVALGSLAGEDLVRRVPLTSGESAAQITEKGLLELQSGILSPIGSRESSPNRNRSRSFRRVCDPTMRTTPISSWNCFPDLVTGMDYPRASDSGSERLSGPTPIGHSV